MQTHNPSKFKQHTWQLGAEDWALSYLTQSSDTQDAEIIWCNWGSCAIRLD